MAKNGSSKGYTGYGEASAAEVHEILDAAYKASVPVNLIGAPGIGKSAIVRAYSQSRFGGPAVTLILSTMDPTDIAGLPTRGETERDGHTVPITEFGMPWWQDALIKGHYPDGTPCKAVFLDEFSSCPVAVQTAVQTMCNERILPCGEKLPDDVQIVLAMNPESSATDYTPLSSPMVNRILQVSYKPTDEEVYEGLSGGWFTEEQQKAWSSDEKSWRARIVDFLRHTNGAFILLENKLSDGAIESEAPAYLQPDAENSDSEREILTSAWASPRSWDNLARVLGHMGFEREVTPIQSRVIAGMVGRQAEVELATYAHQHSQIDPFALIKEPEQQNWKVGDAEGETYNDILELANAINASVPKCDGKNGRPTLEQALDFYSKVIDLGGGAHFMTAFCQSKEGPGHYFKNNMPEGVERKYWMGKVNGILVKFRNADLIPDHSAGQSADASGARD